MSEQALEIARESGLVTPAESLLVLLSGGGDSVCLLDVALRLGAEVSVLHVDHGLRAEAADDEAHCRELCERLGVPLIVERVKLASAAGPGNLQAEARDARYALAQRHARGDYATGHTLSDQAETILYRLATSPGPSALLGMAPRRGRLVRPLLGATREECRAYCEERGLAWREDASNADRRFARARVRDEVLPVLHELSPAAERSIAETARLLREDAEALDRSAEAELERLGGASALPLAELRALPPALARRVLQRAAGAARAGAPGELSAADAEAILGLAEQGSASLDLGGGLRAIAEYGHLRFAVGPNAPPPEPVTLAVPGAVRFGPWAVEASLQGAGDVALSADALGPAVTVRSWREGDRMRPAGLGGTKSLQDLFTDRKVPRELRRSLPVIEAGGEIAWVAGVAVGERFAPSASGSPQIALSARRTG